MALYPVSIIVPQCTGCCEQTLDCSCSNGTSVDWYEVVNTTGEPENVVCGSDIRFSRTVSNTGEAPAELLICGSTGHGGESGVDDDLLINGVSQSSGTCYNGCPCGVAFPIAMTLGPGEVATLQVVDNYPGRCVVALTLCLGEGLIV